MSVACLCPSERSVLPVQVVLLDVNETEGKKVKEILDKQYGRDKTLFITCDVQSEEQIKGNTRTSEWET